ncbi:MAG: hypothetical protein Q4D95_05075 [Peptoniphilus sp.]|nr:hypothetical protein [Peptoniphilus sp.]
MKKFKVLSLSLLLVFIMSGSIFAQRIVKSDQEMVILPNNANFTNPNFFGYNIEGENYFSLRSMEWNLMEKGKSYISLNYSAEEDKVYIEKGGEVEEYTEDDSIMFNLPEKPERVLEKEVSINFKGEDYKLKGYNIDDRNYVKLRDLSKVLDFSVDYDFINKNIIINLEEPYKEALSEEQFAQEHRLEYEKLKAFVADLTTGLKEESLNFKGDLKNLDHGKYADYKDGLLELKKAVTDQFYIPDGEQPETVVDFNYYIELLEGLKGVSVTANELVYIYDTSQSNGHLSPYTGDYVDELLEGLNEIEVELERYANFYESHRMEQAE